MGTLTYYNGTLVAPHAGAWIETQTQPLQRLGSGVAPHAGAWIETAPGAAARAATGRRPPRGGVD